MRSTIPSTPSPSLTSGPGSWRESVLRCSSMAFSLGSALAGTSVAFFGAGALPPVVWMATGLDTGGEGSDGVGAALLVGPGSCVACSATCARPSCSLFALGAGSRWVGGGSNAASSVSNSMCSMAWLAMPTPVVGAVSSSSAWAVASSPTAAAAGWLGSGARGRTGGTSWRGSGLIFLRFSVCSEGST